MSASVLQKPDAIDARADRIAPPSAQAVAWTHEIVAAGIAVSSALLIILLPHVVSWLHYGTPVWFADHDDLDDYLVVASHAYRSHPFYLSDPIHPGGAVYLPWLIMVPGIVIAKMFALGPELINLVYRAEGGLGLAIGFYLLFRFYVGSPWAASGLAILGYLRLRYFERASIRRPPSCLRTASLRPRRGIAASESSNLSALPCHRSGGIAATAAFLLVGVGEVPSGAHLAAYRLLRDRARIAVLLFLLLDRGAGGTDAGFCDRFP